MLGVLVQHDSYGYEIATMLDRQLGPGSSVARSSLYRMLKEMLAQGLLESGSPGERNPHRIVYCATALAEALYVRWLESPLSPEHGPLHLQARMVVARYEDLPRLLGVLNDYERMLFALRAQLEGDMPQRGSLLSSMMFLVRQAPLQRIAGELAWLELSRKTIHSLMGSAG